MLKIRPEQMEEMSEYMLRQFEDRMVIHLRSAFPDQTKEMTEPDLRAMIQAGIDRANGYDITDENDVIRFLEYLCQYGPDFGESSETSWANRFLGDENLSGTTKMDDIDDHELFVIALGKADADNKNTKS